MDLNNQLLRPLYLWKIGHVLSHDKEETFHYLILPTSNVDFTAEKLNLEFWRINGQTPSSIRCIEQISNLMSYHENVDCKPTQVNRLQFYNPGTSEFVNFDREVE